MKSKSMSHKFFAAEIKQAPNGNLSMRGQLSNTLPATDIHEGSQRTQSVTSKQAAPLPVVTTAPSSEATSSHLQIEISHQEVQTRAAKVTPAGLPLLSTNEQEESPLDSSGNYLNAPDPQIASLPSSNMDSNNPDFNPLQRMTASSKGQSVDPTSDRSQPASSRREHHEHHHHHEVDGDGADDEASDVSSLTGAGFDQEIVEELHLALNDLKQQLEESRAEAARAVKVAEQAIQSAENSSSKDWNSTVTHKAAEAAALAQKKSAEAMAKQRIAEERLEGERKNAAFWRKQAETAEEEAGALQTRAAAAEVQRAAMSEALEAERRKVALLTSSMKHRASSTELHQREALESALERNRHLELELEAFRRGLRPDSSSNADEPCDDL